MFNPSPTIKRFMKSGAFYRGLMGPVGSGKSSACCVEIMRRASEQKPNTRKVRKSRFAIIRNTYRELSDTTIKTWQDWFPAETFGNINQQTMSQQFVLKIQNSKGEFDGTLAEVEILFRALDRPQDVKKLLSLELTGAWVNEAREVPKGVVDTLGDRVGRYPTIRDGGCTWRGVIMDTNPPDDDHWWYRLAEEDRPEGWEFWKQPGGLIELGGKFIPNPQSENLENLESGYYLTRMAGKSDAYIRVYYCAQYGFVREGKPVFPEYNDSVHCSSEILEPVKGLPIYVGLDFGLTPAALFGQRLPIGRWQWFDELVTEDMGAVRFGDLLAAKLRGEYDGYEFDIYGDPAGNSRAETDESTPFLILQAKGIPAKPAPSNDFTLRREAVAVQMGRLAMDGKPGFLISPKCKVTRKGMAGGYRFKRVQVAGDERYQDKPDKNKYSHPCEAGQYLMLGAGEGDKLITSPNADKPSVTYQPPPISAGTWMGR
ncbi:MAG: phage terminase large subunit [Dehalococcoidia bacterium]